MRRTGRIPSSHSAASGHGVPVGNPRSGGRRSLRGSERDPPPGTQPRSHRGSVQRGGRLSRSLRLRRTRRPRSVRAAPRNLPGVEGAESLVSLLVATRSTLLVSHNHADSPVICTTGSRGWPGPSRASGSASWLPASRTARANWPTRHCLASAARSCAARFPVSPYPSGTGDRRSDGTTARVFPQCSGSTRRTAPEARSGVSPAWPAT